MRNTGQVLNVNGNLHAVCEQDGKLFLYDPHWEIPYAARNGAAGPGLAGLGLDQGTNAAWGAVNVGLNFVPVVGNILSAISSVAQGIFGGGDPTPIETVWKAVIDTREQLAQAINAVYGAGADPFVVDPSLNRESDGDAPSGGALAAEITANVMKLPSADRHKVKRDSEYAAIKAMQAQLAQLNAALHDRGVAAQVLATLQAPAPAPVLSPASPATVYNPTPYTVAPSPVGVTVTAGNAAQVAPAPSLLPWLLPVGALILYGLTAN